MNWTAKHKLYIIQLGAKYARARRTRQHIVQICTKHKMRAHTEPTTRQHTKGIVYVSEQRKYKLFFCLMIFFVVVFFFILSWHFSVCKKRILCVPENIFITWIVFYLFCLDLSLLCVHLRAHRSITIAVLF